MMIPVCKHFKIFEEDVEEYFITSEGHRWNCWREAYENGKLIYSSFEMAGMMRDYLMHLLGSPRCLEKSGLTRKEIELELEKMEKEWEEVSC